MEGPKYKYAYCLYDDGRDVSEFSAGTVYEVAMIGHITDSYRLVMVTKDDAGSELNGWDYENFFLFNEPHELEMYKVLYGKTEQI